MSAIAAEADRFNYLAAFSRPEAPAAAGRSSRPFDEGLRHR